MRKNAPPIYDWKCDKCGLELPRGDGGYLYVADDQGKRIPCKKGEEVETVKEVLGAERAYSEVKERMGRNQHCICLDCRRQFDADYGFMGYTLPRDIRGFRRFVAEAIHGKTPDRDERKCPRCGSANVRTEREITDETCPKCKEGKIRAIEVKPKGKSK